MMPDITFEEALAEHGDPAQFVRTIGPHANPGHLRLFQDLPDEFTNWREEQRAWKASCALSDLSHHMYDLRIEGPDALDLLRHVGANDFSSFDVGQAKQFVACNPDGYLIGDGILFHLGEDEYNLVGYSAINWVQFHAENMAFDLTTERNEHGGVRDGPPRDFRYQIQGPDALAVVKEAIGGSIPDVPFFNFGDITMAGHAVKALRHGMLDEPGFEIFGPWEHADDVRQALLDAGEPFGIRQIGGRAYPTNVIPVAWIALPVPAIFGDQLKPYREWLDAGAFEGAFTVGGSYEPETVREYHLDPIEVGYGRFVDFDREFIGRDALRERAENQSRQKVTLVWDGDDVTTIFGALFHDESTPKYVNLPTPNWAVSMYDRVEQDGDPVGVSIAPRYLYFEKKLFSIGVVDSSVSTPGTEVTVVWGESGESSNPRVEAHDQTRIRATVHPAPYYEDKKKTTDYTAV